MPFRIIELVLALVLEALRMWRESCKPARQEEGA